jgi:hypothetical protein
MCIDIGKLDAQITPLMISEAIRENRRKPRASANGKEIGRRGIPCSAKPYTYATSAHKRQHADKNRNPGEGGVGGRTLSRGTNVERKDRKVDYAQVLRPVDLQTTTSEYRAVGLRVRSD